MTIAKWIDEGSLPGHTTPGGHRRVAASDFVRFLERHGMRVPRSLRQSHKVRVLAVHSDPDYLTHVAEVILAAPDRYEYRGTTSGVDALVIVGKWRPRVILLDLGLSDLDGVHICRRFSEMASDLDTEIIALAAEQDGVAARAALSAGAAKCVPQNFLPGKLLDFLDDVLGGASRAAVSRSMRVSDL